MKPWLNGQAIAGRNPGLWIIDFGVDPTEEEACQYEKLFEYTREKVFPESQKNNRLLALNLERAGRS